MVHRSLNSGLSLTPVWLEFEPKPESQSEDDPTDIVAVIGEQAEPRTINAYEVKTRSGKAIAKQAEIELSRQQNLELNLCSFSR